MFPVLFTCNPKFVLWFHTELIKNLILTLRLTIIKITPTLHISFCERKEQFCSLRFQSKKVVKEEKIKWNWVSVKNVVRLASTCCVIC